MELVMPILTEVEALAARDGACSTAQGKRRATVLMRLSRRSLHLSRYGVTTLFLSSCCWESLQACQQICCWIAFTEHTAHGIATSVPDLHHRWLLLHRRCLSGSDVNSPSRFLKLQLKPFPSLISALHKLSLSLACLLSGADWCGFSGLRGRGA